ncbi:MAG: V-type ATPase subunit [Oscillospiraceae bacterium]|nr:V-type ATPase subunit [Oscillospiraceae bacterium]
MADAIIAKAKAIYGKRLTPEDYSFLLRRGSVSGVVAYLKETERYHKTFAHVNENQIHRGQVEQLISRDMFELYIRLCKFMAADKNSFCFYLIKELEIKQIIAALIYIKAGSADGYLLEMPTYLMEYACFDLMKLAKATTYREVLEVLSDTPYYKVLKLLLSTFRRQDDMNEAAVTLYAWYINWAFRAIDRSFSDAEAAALKEIFLRRSDLSNITVCYRKKSLFNEDAERIKKSLYNVHYRLTPAMIDEILSRPDAADRLLELLRKMYLKDRIEYDPENLEIAVRRYNYSYYKRQLGFTDNGVMALYSLMVLCETERANLQTIIEGVRYQRPPSETEKLLVI